MDLFNTKEFRFQDIMNNKVKTLTTLMKYIEKHDEFKQLGQRIEAFITTIISDDQCKLLEDIVDKEEKYTKIYKSLSPMNPEDTYDMAIANFMGWGCEKSLDLVYRYSKEHKERKDGKYHYLAYLDGDNGLQCFKVDELKEVNQEKKLSAWQLYHYIATVYMNIRINAEYIHNAYIEYYNIHKRGTNLALVDQYLECFFISIDLDDLNYIYRTYDPKKVDDMIAKRIDNIPNMYRYYYRNILFARSLGITNFASTFFHYRELNVENLTYHIEELGQNLGNAPQSDIDEAISQVRYVISRLNF